MRLWLLRRVLTDRSAAGCEAPRDAGFLPCGGSRRAVRRRRCLVGGSRRRLWSTSLRWRRRAPGHAWKLNERGKDSTKNGWLRSVRPALRGLARRRHRPHGSPCTSDSSTHPPNLACHREVNGEVHTPACQLPEVFNALLVRLPRHSSPVDLRPPRAARRPGDAPSRLRHPYIRTTNCDFPHPVLSRGQRPLARLPGFDLPYLRSVKTGSDCRRIRC